VESVVNNKSEVKVYSVKELTANIKRILKTSFTRIYVKGEISNAKLSSLGHYFFSLKDGDALLNCVMFRNAYSRLKFKIEDGINIIAFGTVSVFEKRGTYNLLVEHIEPEGKGALQLAFEQLKEKLSKEGLFDERYKKVLPEFPSKIGVITSPTGAAFRDILKVINRRYPDVNILLYPSKVQGDGAAETIAKGIKVFNKFFPVDVIIVGRGGGSLEDLWPFNEEVVARAIFESKIPIVSAVGHEIDYTISDFVADKRAPTPSAAAEIITPVKSELVDNIDSLQNRLLDTVNDIVGEFSLRLDRAYDRFENISNNLLVNKRNEFNLLFQRFVHSFDNIIEPKKNEFNLLLQKFVHNLDNVVEPKKKEVEFLSHRLVESYANFVKQEKNKFLNLVNKLNLLSPFQILSRGYSITYKIKDNTIIKSAKDVKKNDKLRIKLGDGALICKVIDETADEEEQMILF